MDKEEKKPSASEAKDDKKTDSASGQEKENGNVDGIDFKAELEREKALREQLEKRLGQAEYKLEKNRKSKSHREDEDDTDDDNDSVSLIADVVEKRLGDFERRLFQSSLQEKLNAITDPDERNLTIFHLENTISEQKIPDINTRIEYARNLANARKNAVKQAQLERIKKAGSVDEGVSGGNNQDRVHEESRQLSEREERLLARRGLSAKDIKRG